MFFLLFKVMFWLLIGGYTKCAIAQATSQGGAPLIISPSGEWDGPDGPWASFNLGIGAQIESFRSLPGMSFSTILLPYTDWCNSTSLAQCEQSSKFDPERFETFEMIGFYELEQLGVWMYNDSDHGLFGTDTITFGRSVNDMRLPNQTIVGLVTEYVPVSLFGLSALPTDFGSGPVPNLITNLTSFATIPSKSFSYTAGAVNRNASTSLILGGYDTSVFDPDTTLQNDLSTFGKHERYFIAVNLTSVSITTDPGHSWRNTTSISVWIDSTFPQIWLPTEACIAFEQAFDLTWNDTLQLYLVNDTHHTELEQRNASVIFSLQSKTGNIMNYTLPYSAFDLKIGAPFLEGNQTSYYFPLKRASSPDQYLLGRTFLQETYITVDYDRQTFNLSQVFPEDVGSSHIFAISPPSNTTSTLPAGTASTNTTRLSVAESAGVGVGATTVVIVVAGLLLAWHKGWGMFQKHEKDTSFNKAELPDTSKSWGELNEKHKWELNALEDPKEVANLGGVAWEMEGSDARYEMGVNSRPSSFLDNTASSTASNAG